MSRVPCDSLHRRPPPTGGCKAERDRRDQDVARRVCDGEGADEQHGLGDAPVLHRWVMQQDAVDISPRWCSVAARRSSKQGRARFTGNATFARRGTSCISPTNACRSRRQGATPLHSSVGGKEMYFLSQPRAQATRTERRHRMSSDQHRPARPNGLLVVRLPQRLSLQLKPPG